MKKDKKILIINCHPSATSFNFGIAEAYKKGALRSGAEVKEIVIRDLKFSPNLEYGYEKRTELEPDLLDAWEKIKWSEHQVWVHPVWWGGLPAIAKGFIDRLFLPGFAFERKEGSAFLVKLLKGRTARILVTLDQPSWYYRLVYGRPSTNQLKKTVLYLCGIKPVKQTYIGIVKNSTAEWRKKWLDKIEQMGAAQS